MSLADVSRVAGQSLASAVPSITAAPTETPITPELSPSVTPEPEPDGSGGVNPQLIIALVLVSAGFIAGYYLLVIRPKHQNNKGYENEDESADTDTDDNDGMDGGFDYDEDEIPYDKPETDEDD